MLRRVLRGACLALLLAMLCASSQTAASTPVPIPDIPAAVASAAAAPPVLAPGSIAPAPALLIIGSGHGEISLAMFAPSGSRVTFSEIVDGRPAPIRDVVVDPAPSPLPIAPLLDAVQWRCDRLIRHFVSVAVAPDGTRTMATAETKTPGCAERLEIAVPPHVARGGLLAVTVADRFELGGFTATVCAARSGRAVTCRALQLSGGSPSIARFRVGGDAVWTVRVEQPNGDVERALTVGDAARPADAPTDPPHLLVTGDSLIQGVDAFVADRLRTTFDVSTDSRSGTGLVKQTSVDWPTLARTHVERYAPQITVISLGVNDGEPIEGHECCDAAWTSLYVPRVRSLMETYLRGRKGRVLWLIAPLPKFPPYARIAEAIAAGIRTAAATEPRVRIVPLDRLLTPGHVFREKMVIDGRRVKVRADDGVHLSVAGERYVAGVVVDDLRSMG